MPKEKIMEFGKGTHTEEKLKDSSSMTETIRNLIPMVPWNNDVVET
jgi:hypothetical protein